jgi:N-acetylglucosamine kinase-like BadF-type ATPase
MGILIADSGSTKTEWAYINDDGIVRELRTIGLNPYFTSEEVFCRVVGAEIVQALKVEENAVVKFYGAGCGNPAQCEAVSNRFKQCGLEQVECGSDLLGAGRALLGKGEGIIGILGTGANAGHFKQGAIISTAPSLGYILGDEGGAVWLGKRILQAYLRKEIPDDIYAGVVEKFHPSRDSVIKHVYSGEAPNRYIAAYAEVLLGFQEHPWTLDLLREGFRLFIQNYVAHFDAMMQKDLFMVGSVASSFEHLLRAVAKEKGFILQKVSTSIMEGLIAYHRNLNK